MMMPAPRTIKATVKTPVMVVSTSTLMPSNADDVMSGVQVPMISPFVSCPVCDGVECGPRKQKDRRDTRYRGGVVPVSLLAHVKLQRDPLPKFQDP